MPCLAISSAMRRDFHQKILAISLEEWTFEPDFSAHAACGKAEAERRKRKALIPEFDFSRKNYHSRGLKDFYRLSCL